MALSYRLTPHSAAVVGRLFGGRDHSTVVHARQRIDELRNSDRKFDQVVRGIEDQLLPP
jgi:chromosomal replication initiator protein